MKITSQAWLTILLSVTLLFAQACDRKWRGLKELGTKSYAQGNYIEAAGLFKGALDDA